NQIAIGSDDVLQHSEDVDLEFLYMRTVEDRLPDAQHPGPDVIDAHLRRGAREPRREQRRPCQQGTEGHNKPSMRHLAFILTWIALVCYRVPFMVGRAKTLQSFIALSATWRWYWPTTEEASALA